MARSSSEYVGCGVAYWRIMSTETICARALEDLSFSSSKRATVDLPLPGNPVIQMHHPFSKGVTIP
jgi:hypothetical protein